MRGSRRSFDTDRVRTVSCVSAGGGGLCLLRLPSDPAGPASSDARHRDNVARARRKLDCSAAPPVDWPIHIGDLRIAQWVSVWPRVGAGPDRLPADSPRLRTIRSRPIHEVPDSPDGKLGTAGRGGGQDSQGVHPRLLCGHVRLTGRCAPAARAPDRQIINKAHRPVTPRVRPRLELLTPRP